MNELLTTQQVAERLGVTTGRVRQMIVDGQLPATKMGRDNFIRESDLKLVEKRQVGRPPKAGKLGEEGKGKNKRAEKKPR